MSRRSSGAVRADPPRIRRPHAGTTHTERPSRNLAIRGLSRSSQRAVDLLGSGTGEALETYRRFLRQPGRWLYVPFRDCPCCDPSYARDALELTLIALPRAARAELRRLIDPLDEEFLRRTLPDPHASANDWRVERWWRQRLYERD